MTPQAPNLPKDAHALVKIQGDKIVVTTKALPRLIEICVAAGVSLCLWGDPGIGKTAMVGQFAEKDSRQLTTIIGSILDPVDLMGLPYITPEGETNWAKPKIFPKMGTRGVLFIDEMNRSTQLVMSALLRLVQERRVGDHVLPKDWAVIAACNEDGIGIQPLSEAMRNRFIHITVISDFLAWCTWANGKDVLRDENGDPIKDKDGAVIQIDRIDPMVVGFLRFRPDLFHKYDKTKRSFPSPRTWEIVSKLTQQFPDEELSPALYGGAVDWGAAKEYYAYQKMFRSLPSIDTVMLSPDTAKVPEEPSCRFGIVTALARIASAENFGRIVKYYNRLPDEFSVLGVRDAVERCPDVQETADYVSWAIKHQHVIL